MENPLDSSAFKHEGYLLGLETKETFSCKREVHSLQQFFFFFFSSFTI
jgi:hypothetical protein